MKRLERQNDPDAALIAVLQGWQAGIHTAYPAVVNSFDGKNNCTCTITIQAQVTARDGSTSWVTLPQLVDVPVSFPGGGGFTLTFPVKQGDECLVVLASRCIDAWWQSSGVQVQADLRMHDLSDGIAFVGLKSQPNALGSVSAVGAQLRSNDGATYVEVDATTITLKAPTSVTIDSPLTTITGDLMVLGKGTISKLLSWLAGVSGVGGGTGNNITGDLTHSAGNLTSNGTNLHTHAHSGVTVGSGNTGNPI